MMSPSFLNIFYKQEDICDFLKRTKMSFAATSIPTKQQFPCLALKETSDQFDIYFSHCFPMYLYLYACVATETLCNYHF